MVSEKVRAHILVEGFVQGIGFRWWCAREAEKLGLVGWVRNLSDGRVEAVFEGPKAEVEGMVKKCKNGPAFSKISHIDVSWEKASGEFTIFDVRPTE